MSWTEWSLTHNVVVVFLGKEVVRTSISRDIQNGMIHYLGPLARQGDFYVPEVREAQRWLLGKKSEEDGGRTSQVN